MVVKNNNKKIKDKKGTIRNGATFIILSTLTKSSSTKTRMKSRKHDRKVSHAGPTMLLPPYRAALSALQGQEQ